MAIERPSTVEKAITLQIMSPARTAGFFKRSSVEHSTATVTDDKTPVVVAAKEVSDEVMLNADDPTVSSMPSQDFRDKVLPVLMLSGTHADWSGSDVQLPAKPGIDLS